MSYVRGRRHRLSNMHVRTYIVLIVNRVRYIRSRVHRYATRQKTQTRFKGTIPIATIVFSDLSERLEGVQEMLERSRRIVFRIRSIRVV